MRNISRGDAPVATVPSPAVRAAAASGRPPRRRRDERLDEERRGGDKAVQGGEQQHPQARERQEQHRAQEAPPERHAVHDALPARTAARRQQARAQEHPRERQDEARYAQHDDLDCAQGPRRPHRAPGGRVPLVQLHVRAPPQVPPPEVLGERAVVDDLPAQPAEVGPAAAAADLVAPPGLGDREAALGAGLGAEDAGGVLGVGAVGREVPFVVGDAGPARGVCVRVEVAELGVAIVAGDDRGGRFDKGLGFADKSGCLRQRGPLPFG